MPRIVWIWVGGIPTAIRAVLVDFDRCWFNYAGRKRGGIVYFDFSAIADIIIDPFGVICRESDATG